MRLRGLHVLEQAEPCIDREEQLSGTEFRASSTSKGRLWEGKVINTAQVYVPCLPLDRDTLNVGCSNTICDLVAFHWSISFRCAKVWKACNLL